MGSTLRTMIWVFFFAFAFTATHTPVDKPAKPIINDKLLHYAGFTFLSALTIWRLRAGRRKVSLPMATAWLAALMIYGAFDELTQPYFHRSCEFFDWLADLGGSVVGISLMLGLQYFQERIRPHAASQTHA